ncbi:MAG: efflux transporter outer membrane subunit [Verrucomicrobiaceae bacterium]|nr:MAG: efflux transporter outer membrane subunit [Verrucomicrobiaceae bacterium]
MPDTENDARPCSDPAASHSAVADRKNTGRSVRLPLTHFSMRSLFLLPGAVLLSSCMLGPDPSSPEVAVPASFRSDTAPHGPSFGDRSWRKVFSDPTLRNLISRALQNNPDLVAATYRIEEARALADVSRASWFPRVDGGAGASADYRSRNSGGTGRRSSESYNLTGLLSWELDLWGGIARDNQAARSRLLQSEFQRDAVQTSLIASVVTCYIDLQNLDERLAIAKRTADSRRGSLDLVTARRDGGVSSDLELGQANALQSQAQVLIPTTERAITEKENELRSLLGEYPGGISRNGGLNRLDSSFRIAGGLPSSLLARRPDIAAADQAFQAATADIGVQEALRLPTLSLTGSGGLASRHLGQLLQGRSAAFSIGPQLNGPLFDAGAGTARVKAAQARAKVAMTDYQKAVQQGFREVADALNAYQKTGEIIAEGTRLLNAQKSVSGIALERFRRHSSVR